MTSPSPSRFSNASRAVRFEALNGDATRQRSPGSACVSAHASWHRIVRSFAFRRPVAARSKSAPVSAAPRASASPHGRTRRSSRPSTWPPINPKRAGRRPPLDAPHASRSRRPPPRRSAKRARGLHARRRFLSPHRFLSPRRPARRRRAEARRRGRAPPRTPPARVVGAVSRPPSPPAAAAARPMSFFAAAAAAAGRVGVRASSPQSHRTAFCLFFRGGGGGPASRAAAAADRRRRASMTPGGTTSVKTVMRVRPGSGSVPVPRRVVRAALPRRASPPSPTPRLASRPASSARRSRSRAGRCVSFPDPRDFQNQRDPRTCDPWTPASPRAQRTSPARPTRGAPPRRRLRANAAVRRCRRGPARARAVRRAGALVPRVELLADTPPRVLARLGLHRRRAPRPRRGSWCTTAPPAWGRQRAQGGPARRAEPRRRDGLPRHHRLCLARLVVHLAQGVPVRRVLHDQVVVQTGHASAFPAHLRARGVLLLHLRRARRVRDEPTSIARSRALLRRARGPSRGAGAPAAGGGGHGGSRGNPTAVPRRESLHLLPERAWRAVASDRGRGAYNNESRFSKPCPLCRGCGSWLRREKASPTFWAAGIAEIVWIPVTTISDT